MARKQTQIFSPKIVMLLSAVAVISMVGALLFASFGEDQHKQINIRQNSFSSSALGHMAFVKLLKAQDIPLLISQYKTSSRVNSDALLLLLEPNIKMQKEVELEELLAVDHLIITLPKWRGTVDWLNQKWVKKISFVPEKNILKITNFFDKDIKIIRPLLPNNQEIIDYLESDKKNGAEIVMKALNTEVAEELDEEEAGKKAKKIKKNQDRQIKRILLQSTNLKLNKRDKSISFKNNAFKDVPSLYHPQLMKSPNLTPIIYSDEGILVGMLKQHGQEIMVISDPDLLSNFGLKNGQNSEIILELVSMMRPNNNMIVIDETTHGFSRNPDIIRSAFDYPYILITFQVLLLIALLIWATLQRFGVAKILPSSLKMGKAVLVENTVILFEQGEFRREILIRYIEQTIYKVKTILKTPSTLSPEDTLKWLDEYGEIHNIKYKISTIKHRANMLHKPNRTGKTTFLDVIHDKPIEQILLSLENWKKEITHGSN